MNFGFDVGQHFERKINKQIEFDFQALPGAILGAPKHPTTAIIMILFRGLLKIEGRPFHAQGSPGMVLVTKTKPKIEPKCVRNSIKKETKQHTKNNNEKIMKKKTLANELKWFPGDLPGSSFLRLLGSKRVGPNPCLRSAWRLHSIFGFSAPPGSPGTSLEPPLRTIFGQFGISKVNY